MAALVWICGGISGDKNEPTAEEMEWFKRLESLWDAQDWPALADLEVRVWGDGIGQVEDRASEVVRRKLREMTYRNLTRRDGECEPCVLEPPAIGRLESITVPVLVIVGDLDTSTTLAAASLLASRVPWARHEVFHNVAHMVSMEKPDEFNGLLVVFWHRTAFEVVLLRHRARARVEPAPLCPPSCASCLRASNEQIHANP